MTLDVRSESTKTLTRRTYTETDLDGYRNEYASPIILRLKRQRAERRTQIRTRVLRVPASAVRAVHATLIAAGGFASLNVPNLSAYVMGAMGAAVLLIAMDVRQAIEHKDPTWRRRHWIINKLFPRHPLDQ